MGKTRSGSGKYRAGGKIAKHGKKLNPKQSAKKFGKEGRAMT